MSGVSAQGARLNFTVHDGICQVSPGCCVGFELPLTMDRVGDEVISFLLEVISW